MKQSIHGYWKTGVTLICAAFCTGLAFADTKVADSAATAGATPAARAPTAVLEVTNGDTAKTTVMIKNGATAAAANAATPSVVVTNAGSVGVGTGTPSASAVLDINSTNKGVLLPRVALTSATDTVTIAGPATGLFVYNTGTAALTTKGFMFWDGAAWRKIDSATSAPPTISSLLCSGATLSPPQYTSGVAYTGVLNVPYDLGNGAEYSAADGTSPVGPVNGLTLTLTNGKLNEGSGSITYKVSGTPSATSPTTTTFPLSFLGSSCSTIVGEGAASVLTKTRIGPMIDVAGGAEFAMNTLDGRFSVRYFVPTNTVLDLTDIQIKSNTGATQNIMWNMGVFYNGGALANSGNNTPVTTTYADIGDPDVYYAGAPENRTFAFMTTTAGDKKIYVFRMMFGAPSTAYASRTSVKAWMYLEEITSN
jgi:hypothetical protein